MKKSKPQSVLLGYDHGGAGVFHRLSPDELDEMAEAARTEGRSRANWIRQTLKRVLAERRGER